MNLQLLYNYEYNVIYGNNYITYLYKHKSHL